MCFGVCAPPVPRPPWLGHALWVCVLGLGFRLRTVIPGWGVGVCVFVCCLHLTLASPGWGVRCGCVYLGSGFGCAPKFLAGVLGFFFWCVRSACTPPILAGSCCVGVCAWAPVWAAARDSWLWCRVVCFGVCAPPVARQSWLGCGVWRCVLRLGFRLRPAITARGVGVCVFVCVFRLYPANPGWSVRCGCVCFGSGCGCARPFLAQVFSCVFWCVRPACIPSTLAGVCGVRVCASARVLAAPHHS